MAASDPTKFADSGTRDTAVAGDHKIKVTLTDVTKAADATDKTADVEITVKKGAAAQTLVSVLKAAITGYAVPDADGKVAEEKTAVPTTRWALQTALQKVVDDFEKDKYTVTVTQFTPTYTPAASGTNSASVLADEAAGTLTSISYDYTVRESSTGNAVDTVGSSSTVTATGGSWNGTAEVTPPEPEEPTVTSVAITAEGAGDDGSVEVEQGGTVTFTAIVTGSDNKPMTEITADKVKWQVEGATNNTDTKIDKDSSDPLRATLTVANDEAGNSSKLTVKVTVDNVESNTVEVTVKTTSTPETPDSGNEESGT